MNTYTAVVETGSCSLDRKRWEIRTDCGHAHRTMEAAERCLTAKQASYCQHGLPAGSLCRGCHGHAQAQATSALWYNGRVHNQNGERV